MSVLQRVSFLPNERFDTPDARALEAFGLNDWRFFLSGVMTNKSLVLTGFDITNYSTVFTVPGFNLKTSNVVLFHTEATTQAAGFYVFAGTESDETVVLSPNATNFVEADLEVTSGTPDVRAFWDQAANASAGGEFTDTVDTAINLSIKITSNISGFTPGKIALYKVITNSSGVCLSVTDARPMFFRLGTGGASPNPSHDYIWPSSPDSAHSRFESPSTATSATISNAPWEGGDKNISNFKAWMDAVMSSIKEVKGTPYWYMPGAVGGGVSGAYQNAALTVLIGGTWQHSLSSLGHLALSGGSLIYRLGQTNAPALAAFADIDLTVHPVLFVILPASDSATTYGMGNDGTTPITPKSIGSLSSSSVTVATGGNYIVSGGKVMIRGQSFTYTSYTAGTGLFSGVSPDPSGLAVAGDDVYQVESSGVAYYHASSVAKVPGISGSVSEGAERVMWLAIYDGSTMIQLHNGDLVQGEQINVGDNTSLNLLTYIGSPNDAATTPIYATSATGTKNSQTQYNSTAGESLTVRASKLTSMMADKAQDKTVQLVRQNISTITNSTSGIYQVLTFAGSTPSLRVVMPSSSGNGTIGLAGSLSLAANQAAYFTIDRNAAFSVADLSGITISSISSVPLNENTYVFALRLTTNYIYLWDADRINVGTYSANQTLSTSVLARLGVLDEDIFEAYSSTTQISSGDSYPQAISILDSKINAILTDVAQEDSQIVGFGGVTTFTSSSLTWINDNTKFDITVWVNGRKQTQDSSGGLLQDYRKTSTTSIEFSYVVPQNSRISVRDERSGGSGGSSSISAHVIPTANNAFDIGSPSFMFRDGYFAGKLTVIGGIDPAYIQLTPQASNAGIPNNSLWIDANDSGNLKITRSSGDTTVGAVSATNVLSKIMENGYGFTIVGGIPVSKLANGKIVPADSDAADGQKYIGITAAAILNGAVGAVLLPGPNVEDAVAGLGFTPGDDIYISESGGYTNDPSSFTGNNDSIIKVGIADCSGGFASAIADDLVMITEVLIRPT